MKHRAEIFLKDLCFAESPRWVGGELWFSDMQDFCVKSATEEGQVTLRVRTPREPSGLGWLPDGSLLVVSMTDQKILRWQGDKLTEHADLSSFTQTECNDMITLPSGRSYVGNFGYDLRRGAPKASTRLLRVDLDGTVSVAATELLFPNGMVVTADGKTLLVAETRGPCISAFDLLPDGSLENRRVWAALDETSMPDGIALDAQGGLWVASPRGRKVFRILEGGVRTDEVDVSGFALACALGGADGRTLFICTSGELDTQKCRDERPSTIETVSVEVPGL
jgi:sugar lactone lactonase YvrE